MLLRLYRLAEDGVTAAVLFLHGAGRFFHVLEGSGFHRRGMRNHGLHRGIDLHHRPATGAGHVKIGFPFRHTRIIPQSASARRKLNGQNVEEVEHLPAEQDDRHDHDQDRQHLAKVQAGFVGVEATRSQAENVERSKPENQRPENVVDFFTSGDQQECRRQSSDRKRVEATSTAGYPLMGLPKGK